MDEATNWTQAKVLFRFPHGFVLLPFRSNICGIVPGVLPRPGEERAPTTYVCFFCFGLSTNHSNAQVASMFQAAVMYDFRLPLYSFTRAYHQSLT